MLGGSPGFLERPIRENKCAAKRVAIVQDELPNIRWIHVHGLEYPPYCRTKCMLM